MAFNPVFQFSFLEIDPSARGLTANRYRVSFLRDGFSGSITQVLPGKAPIKREYPDATDGRYSPFLPTKYTFSFACQDYWNAQSFYVLSEQELQVLIEVDTTGVGTSYSPFWWGWVQPTDLKEAYQGKPYPVEVSAACGLSLLKDKPLLAQDGTRLKDFVSITQVMRQALEYSGFHLDLETGFNRYELSDVAVGQTSGGLANPQTDPLYQTLVHAETYVTDSGEVFSCYDALKKELEPFGLRITQQSGRWIVLNSDEGPGGYDKWNSAGNTIHTRLYQQTDLSAGPGSHYSRDLSARTDPHGALPVNEGTYWLESIQNGIRIEQSFGRHLNKLSDFSQVDGTGLPVGTTVHNIVTASRYRTGSGTDASPYALTILGDGDEKINDGTPSVRVYSLSFSTASRDYTHFNHRTFKTKAYLTNVRAAKIFFVATRDDGPYLLTGGDWVRLDKLTKAQSVAMLFYNNYTDSSGHIKAKPGWFDISADLGTIDRVSRLDIYYGFGEALDYPDAGVQPKVDYQAGTLEVETQGLILDGTQQTIVKAGKLVKDTTLSLSLGDVPDAALPYDRIGTLFRRSTQTATTLWYEADQVIGGSGENTSLGKSLLTILAQSRAKQAMAPALVWEGTLIGRLPWGIHTVVYISDLGENDSNGVFQAYPLQITRCETDFRAMTHRVTLVRNMNRVAVTLPATKYEWQTPDGLISANTDSTGPPDNSGLSAHDKLLKELTPYFQTLKPSLSPVLPGFTPLSPSASPRPTLLLLGTGGAAPISVVPGLRLSIDLHHLV